MRSRTSSPSGAWRGAAILFDLDGVLVDSRRCVEAVWRAWAARKGIDPAPFLRIAHGRMISDTLRTVAPSLDVGSEVALLDRMEEVETAGIHPAPGAAALVDSLPPARWGIVTSGSYRVATLRLGCVGLPVPETFVTAEAVSRSKPAPDGYLLAADRLGAAPAECIVIEDSPVGIAAARAAGMRVIALLTTHQPEALGDADVVLPALTHLRASPVETGVLLEVRRP